MTQRTQMKKRNEADCNRAFPFYRESTQLPLLSVSICVICG